MLVKDRQSRRGASLGAASGQHPRGEHEDPGHRRRAVEAQLADQEAGHHRAQAVRPAAAVAAVQGHCPAAAGRDGSCQADERIHEAKHVALHARMPVRVSAAVVDVEVDDLHALLSEGADGARATVVTPRCSNREA